MLKLNKNKSILVSVFSLTSLLAAGCSNVTTVSPDAEASLSSQAALSVLACQYEGPIIETEDSIAFGNNSGTNRIRLQKHAPGEFSLGYRLIGNGHYISSRTRQSNWTQQFISDSIYPVFTKVFFGKMNGVLHGFYGDSSEQLHFGYPNNGEFATTPFSYNNLIIDDDRWIKYDEVNRALHILVRNTISENLYIYSIDQDNGFVTLRHVYREDGDPYDGRVDYFGLDRNGRPVIARGVLVLRPTNSNWTNWSALFHESIYFEPTTGAADTFDLNDDRYMRIAMLATDTSGGPYEFRNWAIRNVNLDTSTSSSQTVILDTGVQPGADSILAIETTETRRDVVAMLDSTDNSIWYSGSEDGIFYTTPVRLREDLTFKPNSLDVFMDECGNRYVFAIVDDGTLAGRPEIFKVEL